MTELPGMSSDQEVPAHVGDPLAEQRAMSRAAAVVDRSHRGVVAVNGPDRLSWLHLLLTQARVLHFRCQPERLYLRVLEDFLDIEDGAARHAGGVERVHPLLARTLDERLLHLLRELGPVLRARGDIQSVQVRAEGAEQRVQQDVLLFPRRSRMTK